MKPLFGQGRAAIANRLCEKLPGLGHVEDVEDVKADKAGLSSDSSGSQNQEGS